MNHKEREVVLVRMNELKVVIKGGKASEDEKKEFVQLKTLLIKHTKNDYDIY